MGAVETTTLSVSDGTATERPSRLDARWRLVLLGVFALAIVVRVVYGLEIRRSPIPELWRAADTDMSFFVAWGQIVAGGDWLTDRALHPLFGWQRSIGTLADWNAWYGGKTFHQAPLYPYLLAVLFRIVGSSLWSVYILQALGSAATAVLIAAITRRCIGTTAGLLAGVMAAVYGPLVFCDFVALRASLTVLLSAMAVWLLIRAQTSERGGWWLAAGVVMGLGFLLRPNAVVMLALALLGAAVLHWGRWRELGTGCIGLIAGFAVCLTPLALRNVRVGAPPLSVSAVGASTFYIANAAGAPGTGWGITPRYPMVMRRTDGRLGPLAREAWASHDSIAGVIGLLIAKLTATAHYFERANNANPYYAERFSALLRYGGLSFWIVMPLAVTGLVLTWPERRRLIWLYVAVLVPLATIVLFYQTSRFRLPMMVGLIPLAAAGVEWMIVRRGNVAGWLLITAAMCVAVRWPADGDPPRVQARDLYVGANVLSQVGRHEQAVAEARLAVERFPEAGLARLAILDALRAAGRIDQAAEACDQAIVALPDSLPILTARAEVLLDQRKVGPAIMTYRRVLRMNARHAPAAAGLARALAVPGPQRDMRRAVLLAAQAVRLAPGDAEIHETYANVLVAGGKPDQALAALREGLDHIALTDPKRADLERLRDDLEKP